MNKLTHVLRYVIPITLLATGLLIVTRTVLICVPTQQSTQPTQSHSVADSVYTHIYTLRIQHPQVVFAQCVLESGWFTSKLFTHANNCTGMRCPMQRPTTAIGVLYNHAHYTHWKQCLTDYAIWQTRYAHNLSQTDYLTYLGRVYATDTTYVRKLHTIINKL